MLLYLTYFCGVVITSNNSSGIESVSVGWGVRSLVVSTLPLTVLTMRSTASIQWLPQRRQPSLFANEWIPTLLEVREFLFHGWPALFFQHLMNWCRLPVGFWKTRPPSHPGLCWLQQLLVTTMASGGSHGAKWCLWHQAPAHPSTCRFQWPYGPDGLLQIQASRQPLWYWASTGFP